MVSGRAFIFATLAALTAHANTVYGGCRQRIRHS
jgi:hypothetical protein